MTKIGFYTTLWLWSNLIESLLAARILGLFHSDGRSHLNFHEAIMKSLLAAGHHVTVWAAMSSTLSHENYTSFNFVNRSEDVEHPFAFATRQKLTSTALMIPSLPLHESNCRQFMKFEKQLNVTGNFDIIFVELLHVYQCFFPLAKKAGIPIIGTISLLSFASADRMIGNPRNPSVLPVMFSKLPTKMSFYDRIENVMEEIKMHQYFSVENQIVAKFVKKFYPDQEKLKPTISLLFVNGDPSILPTAQVPNSIYIGGINVKSTVLQPLPEDEEQCSNLINRALNEISANISMVDIKLKRVEEHRKMIAEHEEKVKLLGNSILKIQMMTEHFQNFIAELETKRNAVIERKRLEREKEEKLLREKLPLKTFIEGAENGVILLSLGTITSSDSIEPDVLAALINAFAKIPQRILWKFSGHLKGISKNVLVMDWLPQKEILAHENVKAFISHCGIGSLYEAVFYGKPMILMPVFADQPANAGLLESLRVGKYLDFTKVTETELLEALDEVINGTTYRENMEKLSRIFKDEPISPSEKVVFWTEYILRHNGTAHLRSEAMDMPMHQYLLLDIIAFLIVGVILTSFCVYFLQKIFIAK